MIKKSSKTPNLPTRKSILFSLIIILIIGLSIYIAAVLWFGWARFVLVFNDLGSSVFLIAAAASSFAYVLRFGRWHYALFSLGCKVPIWFNFKVYLAGMSLTASPAKLGETVRSVLLLPYGVKVQFSLAAVFADRATDVLGVSLLGVLVGLVIKKSFWLLASIFVLILVVGCLLRFLGNCREDSRFWLWCGQAFRWLPIVHSRHLLNTWAELWTVGKIATFTLLALLAYGLQAIVFSWFCSKTGISVPFADAILIFVQATLFGAASMIPGGLGAMEAALVVQLAQYGVENSLAVSVAIATRFVTFWLGLIIGFLALASSLSSFRAQQDDASNGSLKSEVTSA
jgi:uncharacterized membrane protein YbhN (UPF0104 family)